MTRFWFEFDFTNYENPPMGALMGCGVTASSSEKAKEYLKEKVFTNRTLPPIINFIENVEISKLDANHVLPNMGSPFQQGIWFPLGYDSF